MPKSYPDAYAGRMRAQLGDEYAAFAQAMERAPTAALRVNPKRAGAKELLTAAGVPGDPVPWAPDGYYVADGFRPGADPLHAAGGYYMQDASAMAAARVLNVSPGMRVLDLCAAPGGKSGQLAQMLAGEGALMSNEPDMKRAQALSGNLERLGADNACVVSALPEALSAKWADAFDAVLVDAPCSGEGMFRRDPAAIAQWSPERADGCARRQQTILIEAVKMLAPGGRLVYSTCTFNPAENEDNVRYLLGARPDLSAARFDLPGVGRSENGCMHLWPHRVRGEGHFIALLERAGERGQKVDMPKPVDRDAVRAFELLKATLPGTWHERYVAWQLALNGDALWAIPPGLPDASGVKVLRPGLRLARVSRGYVKPDHALAMAADPMTIDNRADVDAQKYLRGEALAGDQAGWALATWHGLALGFVKGSSGALKNHLPKGLRTL